MIVPLTAHPADLRRRGAAAPEAAARANHDLVTAQCRSALLVGPLQNVADTLHAMQEGAGALRIASANARSAHTVLDLTQRQYGHGHLDHVALIIATQADRQASMPLLQARAARLSDTIALFQALGGSWQDAKAPSDGRSDEPHPIIQQRRMLGQSARRRGIA